MLFGCLMCVSQSYILTSRFFSHFTLFLSSNQLSIVQKIFCFLELLQAFYRHTDTEMLFRAIFRVWIKGSQSGVILV